MLNSRLPRPDIPGVDVNDRIVVRLSDDPGYPGVAYAVAPDQVGMYTHKVRRIGERVEFTLEADSGDVVRLQGEVTASRHIPDGWAPACRYELRVDLIEPPPEYSVLIGETDGALDQREDTRIPATLSVEFVEPPGVGSAMTRNIAEGGAFVESTSDQLTHGTICVVRIALPGIPGKIWAVGRVVRVDEQGVGLCFIEMQTDDRVSDMLEGYRSPVLHAEPRLTLG
ncbi:MAG: hypothetical protein ACI9WU_001319 [Myxococcota bacterium]